MGRTTVIMLLLLKIKYHLGVWTWSKERKRRPIAPKTGREQARRGRGMQDALIGYMEATYSDIEFGKTKKKVVKADLCLHFI